MTKCPRQNCQGQVVLLWADGGEIEVCLQCRRTPNQQVPTFTEDEIKRDSQLRAYSRADYSR